MSENGGVWKLLKVSQANWKCLTVSENVQEWMNMLGNKGNVQKCPKQTRNVVKYMKIYGNVLELSEQVWINLRMPAMCEISEMFESARSNNWRCLKNV